MAWLYVPALAGSISPCKLPPPDIELFVTLSGKQQRRPLRVFRENVTGNADGQLEALIPALEGPGWL